MSPNPETKEQCLERLQQELRDLKSKLPEHCAGTNQYISTHRTNLTHWQKIEDTEDAIAKLKKELGC
jgi:hypothetical protein